MEIKNKQLKNRINFFLLNNFKPIALLLALLLLLVGFLLLYSFKYKKIKEESKVVTNEAQLSGASVGQLGGEFKTIEKQYREVDLLNKEKINKILSLRSNSEELFAILEKLVLQNGLLISSLSLEEVGGAVEAAMPESQTPAPPSQTQSVSSAPSELGIIKASLEIKGLNYNGLKNLLESFENNLRIMDIKSLNFSPSSESVSLEVFVYYLKNESSNLKDTNKFHDEILTSAQFLSLKEQVKGTSTEAVAGKKDLFQP